MDLTDGVNRGGLVHLGVCKNNKLSATCALCLCTHIRAQLPCIVWMCI